VRDEFLHAWKSYRKHAWGNDELKPMSQRGQDTFGNIGMIVLDSLTTLWLMGLEKEFEHAASFVDRDLDFDTADREVSVFELNIRALGGLLGAHALTGRRIFLQRATELGERLLPALSSPSGFPWPRWNIARQGRAPTAEPTILAEAGSLQLEFRYLSALTGDPRYKKAVDVNFDAIQSLNISGLIPVHLSPPSQYPPRAFPDRLALGALADSYYEYLLKQWLQSPQEPRFKELWLAVMDDIPKLVHPTPQEHMPAHIPNQKLIEVAPTGRPIWKMDHLSCFTPGMIALGLQSVPTSDLQINHRNSTWWQMAQGLTASCAEMWTSTKSGLAPEYVHVKPSAPFDLADPVEGFASHSFLRPETAESLFYLYRLTGDSKWRDLGKQIFHAIVKHAKTSGGFASVKNVHRVPTEKLDEMQSFVMAETFKYLYLLFSPAEVLDLDKFVLNTEGHPFRKLGPW
jgi:mannosyl-oligosaccharide alpha-1,2-mannosidase